jgi:hypothetical protein
LNCESWVSKKSHSIQHPIRGTIYSPKQKITKFTHLNIQKPNNYNFVYVFQSDSFPWKFISSIMIWFWSWTDFCFKLKVVCYLVDLSTFRLKYDASGEQPLEECRRQVCLCFSNQNPLFFASIFYSKRWIRMWEKQHIIIDLQSEKKQFLQSKKHLCHTSHIWNKRLQHFHSHRKTKHTFSTSIMF